MSNKDNKYLQIMESRKEIPKALIRMLKSNKKLILYGNGNQGVVCEETLVDSLGFNVTAILKSDEYKGIEGRYTQLPCYCVSESPYKPDEVSVIISLGREASEIVLNNLSKLGYSDVFMCEDWTLVNAALREIKFESMMKEHGVVLDKTRDYIQIKDFLFNNPWKEKENYLSFFLGEFGELVAPHVLNDFSALRTEGPYCLGEVDIKKNDVVLDLGANIGLFSAAAASVGCKVYSFEPIDFVFNYLDKSARLYGNRIELVNAAATDHDGTIQFNVVSEEFHDIGESSVLDRGNSKNFKKMTVAAKTIDKFVKDKGLDRVDFIKADIEGSERDMLAGAQETLRRFAPKLSLCTYHLPDDKEVMTERILKANPNYKIEYKWEKLYAYVP